MKNVISIIIVISFSVINTSLVKAAGRTFDGKIGTAYATDPEKFGLQLNFAYFADLDPYFVAGIEPGIYWIKWDRKVGTRPQGEYTADVKADTNAYLFPILLDAQIRLPNLKKKTFVLPYFTIGLGYSLMIYNYEQPTYTDSVTGVTVIAEDKTKFYSGFTWHFLAGATVKPGSESSIEFLAELGYRGAKLKKGNLEVDMSGFLLNIGVRYPFGKSRSRNNVIEPTIYVE
ncbi:MAG: outer membrane beta-barrel protein [Spirochaetota bacterium]|nr:outer membrane beta-barrel protein [Spirochaetota bacterium]